jgi:hypothetical protein
MRLSIITVLALYTNSLFAQGPDEYWLGLEEYAVHTSGDLEGMTTYRLYLNMINPTDYLSACTGSEENPWILESTSTPAWYQHPEGSETFATGINSAFFTAFPDLEYDSWFTIGVEDNSVEMDVLAFPDPTYDAFAAFESGENVYSNTQVGNGWATLFPGLGADNAGFAGEDLKVLVAQITTSGTLSGSLYVQIFPEGIQDPDVRLLLPIVQQQCNDPVACNYNVNALFDDGSCWYAEPNYDCGGECVNDDDSDGICNEFEIQGCTDVYACNYISAATDNDGSCDYSCYGCIDITACNFDPSATENDGSCTYPGCNDMNACNYSQFAGCDDGSCTYPGCNDMNACNYDEFAGCNDGSCAYPGCTDSTAINYDANAGCDDGSCISSFGALDIIAPASIYYSDTLEVNLMITGGDDVYGAYASLQYDTSLLLLVGDNLGTYFGDDVLTSPAQDINGIVEFGATNMGPVSGANGDGLFYTLRFIPIGPIEPSNSETLISIINNEAYTSEGLPGGLFYPEGSTVEIIYEAEVWPGDLNHDYEVNVSDILPIGYFYGETGPERPDATLQWESQPCPLWDVGMDFPGDGFYKVFADGNGDGEIQLSDQIAVGININQSIVGMAPFEDELNMMVMGGGDITPVVISSSFNPNTINLDVENEVTFVVSATTDTSNQNLFHGISVSMDLSEILNDANNVSVDYSNSGMGELNSTMIALDYAEDYQLDVAITRTNNNYLLGEFELFSINLPLIDLPSGEYQIPIIVNESNNSEGASVLTTVIPSTLIINSSNSIEEQSNCNITVYPNPASNNLTVDLGDLNGVNTTIKLYDSSSKLVFEKQSSSTLMIDVSGFAKGMYSLELSTDEQVLRSQVIID